MRFLLPLLALALAYTATAQPTWRFHLAFEDGSGARDTLWFVWDTTATVHYVGTPPDYDLGEGPVDMDTTAFNMWMYNGNDERTQTDAQPYLGGFYPMFGSFEIWGENFIGPMTIRWDSSLFNAPFLPEPVFAAALNGEFFFWYHDPYVPDFPPGYIPGGYVCWLTGRDSVVLPDIGGTPLCPFTFQIGDSSGGMGIDANAMEPLSMHANGSTLTISAQSAMDQICIHDLQGRMVGEYPVHSNTACIPIIQLPGGLYMVRAQLKNGGVSTGRFIRH